MRKGIREKKKAARRVKRTKEKADTEKVIV